MSCYYTSYNLRITTTTLHCICCLFFLSISKPGFSHIMSAFQGFPDHQPTPHQFLTSPEFKITFAPPLNGSQLFNNNSLAAFSLSAINQSAQKLKSLLPHQTCGSTSNGGSTNMVSSKNWANKDTNWIVKQIQTIQGLTCWVSAKGNKSISYIQYSLQGYINFLNPLKPSTNWILNRLN